MRTKSTSYRWARASSVWLACALVAGCATLRELGSPYETRRDKTAKGAGIGAAAGAVGAVLAGEREADEILAGAAIGATVGAGVGTYMDHQEEQLARIPGTRVERVDEDLLLVHFDSNVLFDVDSAAVRGDGQAILDDIAGVLLDFEKTAVVVQGHTDATGTEEHNLQLSQWRADAARSILVREGVEPERMTAIGYGEGYPVASNDTTGGRQLNRRVDILLKAKVT